MMRAKLLTIAFLALGACGLTPLYSGGSSGGVAGTLGSVEVSSIPGQSGWLVQNKLRERFSQSQARNATYRLDVTLDDNITTFGVRSNQAASQERRTLRARYQLVDLQNGIVVLDATAGSDATLDIVSSEYATVAAEQTALENLSEELANQITARVALFASRMKAR